MYDFLCIHLYFVIYVFLVTCVNLIVVVAVFLKCAVC